MSLHTSIHYCDSSLNLMMGCDGCELWDGETVKDCYAGNLIGRHAGQPGWPEAFDKPKLFLDRLDAALKWPDLTGKPREHKPWLNGYPRIIFVDDLGDTWTRSLPVDWLAPLLPRMADSPHIWLFCTKRLASAAKFFETHPAPRNLWLLATVTRPASLGRIAALLSVPGISVRGLSLEPLWGMPDLQEEGLYNTCPECGTLHRRGWHDCTVPDCDGHPSAPALLDWLAIGGQSGPRACPCDVSWIYGLLRQAKDAGIPAFVKQLGAVPVSNGTVCMPWPPGKIPADVVQTHRVQLRDRAGSDWYEWPEDLRVRQMPKWGDL